MIDYDYVECTSSALQALCLFQDMYPDHRAAEVNSAKKQGASPFQLNSSSNFLHTVPRPTFSFSLEFFPFHWCLPGRRSAFTTPGRV